MYFAHSVQQGFTTLTDKLKTFTVFFWKASQRDNIWQDLKHAWKYPNTISQCQKQPKYTVCCAGTDNLQVWKNLVAKMQGLRVISNFKVFTLQGSQMNTTDYVDPYSFIWIKNTVSKQVSANLKLTTLLPNPLITADLREKLQQHTSHQGAHTYNHTNQTDFPHQQLSCKKANDSKNSDAKTLKLHKITVSKQSESCTPNCYDNVHKTSCIQSG